MRLTGVVAFVLFFDFVDETRGENVDAPGATSADVARSGGWAGWVSGQCRNVDVIVEVLRG